MKRFLDNQFEIFYIAFGLSLLLLGIWAYQFRVIRVEAAPGVQADFVGEVPGQEIFRSSDFSNGTQTICLYVQGSMQNTRGPESDCVSFPTDSPVELSNGRLIEEMASVDGTRIYEYIEEIPGTGIFRCEFAVEKYQRVISAKPTCSLH